MCQRLLYISHLSFHLFIIETTDGSSKDTFTLKTTKIRREKKNVLPKVMWQVSDGIWT